MDLNNNKAVKGDQQEHPLLNPLVVENVLKFCKGHRDQDGGNTFPTLRLVCKSWDIEVSKVLRPQTEMPLARILSPYPEGLGWKWNQSHRNTGYLYQSPYLETPEFENIKVTAQACNVIKDPKVIRWFHVMGGQVKSLHYSSPLNCSHQNVFLGNVLDCWCPNLETLHLSGIQCFSSLLYICEGMSQAERVFNGTFNCANLKNLIISVDSEEISGQFLECHHKTDYCLLENRRRNLSSVESVHKHFAKLLDIYPEEIRGKKKYVMALYSLVENGMEMNKTGPNFLTDKFNELLEKSPYHKTEMLDWGILGHLLRAAPLQKIVVRKLLSSEQCGILAMFLLYQPSKLRTTLNHLEFQSECGIGRSRIGLRALSWFQCPLRVLHLDSYMPCRISLDHLYNLLNSCAGTLTSLELGIAQFDISEESILCFVFPQLPNLERFVQRNLSRLPIVDVGLLENCPKLKVCILFDGQERLPDYPVGTTLNLFCDKLVGCESHPLRELKIDGKSLSIVNIKGVGVRLRNLVKVDLVVKGWFELGHVLGWNGFGGGCEKLENVRISIMDSEYGGAEDGGDRWNRLMLEDLCNLESVKFLDICFRGKAPNLSVEAFKKGFAKLSKLTCLKITNFWVSHQDWLEIMQISDHIQFKTFSKIRIGHCGSRERNVVVEPLCIL